MTAINTQTMEDQVVDLIRGRLDLGLKQYGRMHPDKKDWIEEALEEALDMSVYLCAELIRLRQLRALLLATDHFTLNENAGMSHEEARAAARTLLNGGMIWDKPKGAPNDPQT